MIIKSIEFEMDITTASGELAREIEAKLLQEWGEPLRWAITAVDRETNIAQIEAIAIEEISEDDRFPTANLNSDI